jgi:hypothetical protein
VSAETQPKLPGEEARRPQQHHHHHQQQGAQTKLVRVDNAPETSTKALGWTSAPLRRTDAASSTAASSSSKGITYEILRECFHMPIAKVSKHLGVCTTLLKKICRKLNLKKWPHRQIRKIDNCVVSLKCAMQNANARDQELFLEQIEGLRNMRQAILDDPNGTHALAPSRHFSNGGVGGGGGGDNRGVGAPGQGRVRAPKQMGAILNKFNASHTKKNQVLTSPPSELDADGAGHGSTAGEEVVVKSASLVASNGMSPNSTLMPNDLYQSDSIFTHLSEIIQAWKILLEVVLQDESLIFHYNLDIVWQTF